MIKWLNPVKYFQDKNLLLLNLLIFCLGTFLAVSLSARFDGILDLHFLPFSRAVITMTDNIVNIVFLTFILFALGRFINPKARIIDCLNTAFYSRIPFYLLCLTNIGGEMPYLFEPILLKVSDPSIILPTSIYVYVIIFTLVSFLVLASTIIILFNGFKIATNAKSTKHYLFFVLAILIAEISTSIFLKNL